MKKNVRPTEAQSAAFKGGSRTFYTASLFFPPKIRTDVVRFYAFVRSADDLVDTQPQNAAGFYQFRDDWCLSVSGTPSGNPIVDDFVVLSKEHGFEKQWTEDFLSVMESDLGLVRVVDRKALLRYTWGSAEVIGLFLSCILGLPRASRQAAILQGRSLQMINFIRDIREDNELGRSYLPLSETSLPDLLETTANKNPEEFSRFLRAQIRQYEQWQKEADAGYCFIPRRYRVAIKTARDMYNWTARRIKKDPFLVFKFKLKPAKHTIFFYAIKNLLTA